MTGKSQSPIDIDLDEIDEFVHPAEPLLFLNYDETVSGFTLTNNGHTVAIHVNHPCRISVGGGGLNGLYLLDHIHFHWGSEHTVNHRRFPAEVHLVHYSKAYSNLSAALQHPRGVAVIGVLLDEGEEENQLLQPLLSVTSDIIEYEEIRVPVESYSLDHLLPKDTTEFYRYDGSLTTPPCTEAVLWTVLKDTVVVSKQQVKQLNDIHLSHGVTNFRPPQQLNGRSVDIMSSASSFEAMKQVPRQNSATTTNLANTVTAAAILFQWVST